MTDEKMTQEGEILGYRAWDRKGGEHLADTPEAAACSAYHAKVPGKKRRAVLVMARKRGGYTFDGGRTEYSVPLGWWSPG